MHWKLKAALQNIVSYLPQDESYATYYWLQRNFGGLRKLDPTDRLSSGIATWHHILRHDHAPVDKIFFEVGTGRVPMAPLAYWLMGAKGTISFDLNPYMKEELLSESLRYILDREAEIRDLFGCLLIDSRFDELLSFASRPMHSLAEFLELCQIQYIAPGDAADTCLPDQHIDFYISLDVFEHIPLGVLRDILIEGKRITKRDGLLVHKIDYSDHFSHSDSRISPINFLQYSEGEWQRYAGNRYMFMNRLRHDDFVGLFESVGHRVLDSVVCANSRLRDQLEQGGLLVNERFRAKSSDVLSITGAWIIASADV